MDEREILLQRYLDGEADASERLRAEAMIAEDPELAEMIAASRAVGDALGQSMRAQAAEVDYAALWTSIEREIDWYDSGRARALAASAEQVGVPEGDVSWRDSFRRLLGWRFLAGFATLAAALLVVPQFVSQMMRPELGGGPVGQVEVVAQAPRFDGVEVDSVEYSDGATVMVFQGGEGAATFIWVNETESGDEGQAI